MDDDICLFTCKSNLVEDAHGNGHNELRHDTDHAQVILTSLVHKVLDKAIGVTWKTNEIYVVRGGELFEHFGRSQANAMARAHETYPERDEGLYIPV